MLILLIGASLASEECGSYGRCYFDVGYTTQGSKVLLDNATTACECQQAAEAYPYLPTDNSREVAWEFDILESECNVVLSTAYYDIYGSLTEIAQACAFLDTTDTSAVSGLAAEVITSAPTNSPTAVVTPLPTVAPTGPTPAPTPADNSCGSYGRCYHDAAMTTQGTKQPLAGTASSCECQRAAEATPYLPTLPLTVAWEFDITASACNLVYSNSWFDGDNNLIDIDQACAYFNASDTSVVSEVIAPPSPTPAPTPLPCRDLTQYNWPRRIQVVQSGCSVDIIRQPTPMPDGFAGWTAGTTSLLSTTNAAASAALTADNTELQFFVHGAPAGVDPIHVVGACSSSATGAGKLCTAWHRQDCMMRTGANHNDCSCYCDALPRIVDPRPDCPEGSEGVVYQSSTYRLPVVKPCVEWTPTDCGLQVSGTRGCPCVCGHGSQEPAVADEVLHWVFILGATASAAAAVLALAVLCHDTTRLIEGK